jgi:diaminopropionate ammonia-lyase
MSIHVVANPNRGTRRGRSAAMLALLAPGAVEEVAAFHRSIDGYAPTPLVELPHLAARLGVKSLLVKDESYRFGLNAFKALGGSYAIGTILAGRLGVDVSGLPFPRMISDAVRERLGEVTFVTATDGNHGRGVAWTAHMLRQKCVVHMPRGSAPERLENIRALGATADITELNYDDAVRLSAREADEYGWVLVQDTSWPGYEDIPRAIIRGYTTMLAETVHQLRTELNGDERGLTPTHVFVQAGVGALPTAVVGYIVNAYGTSDEGGPVIVVVEPTNAACIYETLRATDGRIHAVGGDLDTIMAGLACGEPVTVGVDLLADYVDFVASVGDYVAAQGMRVLSSPVPADAGTLVTGAPDGGLAGRSLDRRIVSGESGAAPFGLAYEVLTVPALAGIKDRLGINENSVLLFFSTEGDTDTDGYTDIVANGAHPRPAP